MEQIMENALRAEQAGVPVNWRALAIQIYNESMQAQQADMPDPLKAAPPEVADDAA